MHATDGRSGIRALILAVLPSAGLLMLPGCASDPTQPRAPIDLAPFTAMARESQCADVRNQLFLIDGILVFWNRAGHCADATYAQTLFGGTVEDVLCSSRDTIAGPMKECRNPGYRAMFETITANADKADLGLWPAHKVQAIPL